MALCTRIGLEQAYGLEMRMPAARGVAPSQRDKLRRPSDKSGKAYLLHQRDRRLDQPPCPRRQRHLCPCSCSCCSLSLSSLRSSSLVRSWLLSFALLQSHCCFCCLRRHYRCCRLSQSERCQVTMTSLRLALCAPRCLQQHRRRQRQRQEQHPAAHCLALCSFARVLSLRSSPSERPTWSARLSL